ncbi:hypothetical protein M3N64_03755 [Sporolactobacillus sp. CPB3-1]|uniref:DUF305 domain-containing protein n=1 Tax=Sporolactobacillus mangiferae TaxID=2940498 RepID=A0ABT0M869_9BACL|nr:hypothetical protein [Sporolactobacillus mangiferae]MCL1631061.1 hypothetical protein [Sporolactobacillus mangiferae]
MKYFRFSVVLFLMMAWMAPQSIYAAGNWNPDGVPGHETHHQWLVHVAEQYAPAELATQVKNDMDKHHQLMTQWKQTPDFKQTHQKCHKKRQEVCRKIDAIKKEQAQGKLSAREAHEKIRYLFRSHLRSKRHLAIANLQEAVKHNDRQTIIKALKQIDHHIQKSNTHLTEKLNKAKG